MMKYVRMIAVVFGMPANSVPWKQATGLDDSSDLIESAASKSIEGPRDPIRVVVRFATH